MDETPTTTTGTNTTTTTVSIPLVVSIICPCCRQIVSLTCTRGVCQDCHNKGLCHESSPLPYYPAFPQPPYNPYNPPYTITSVVYRTY